MFQIYYILWGTHHPPAVEVLYFQVAASYVLRAALQGDSIVQSHMHIIYQIECQTQDDTQPDISTHSNVFWLKNSESTTR